MGYEGGITQLKAFVAQHKRVEVDPVVRFETPPGRQMQADFTQNRHAEEPDTCGKDRISMLEPLSLLTGIAVLTLWVADILKTTLSSNSGGPITNTIGRWIWKICFAASGRKGRSGLLNYSGMVVLVTILLIWIVGLWLGLFLVLLSDPASVVSSRGAPTDALEKLYFAGFSLSTLGVGDYKAASDGWRVATSAAAFAGLVLITTSVTYFVPVLSAVSLQNRIALHVNSLGKTPQEIVRNGWNGKDFSSFARACEPLHGMLQQHTLHHGAYPVLHYFHHTDPRRSFKRSIVLFAEAFYLIRHAFSHVDSDNGTRMQMDMLETALDDYFATVARPYADARASARPPLPDMAPLRELGMPAKASDALHADYLAPTRQRRELHASLLAADGWAWQDVYGAAGD